MLEIDDIDPVMYSRFQRITKPLAVSAASSYFRISLYNVLYKCNKMLLKMLRVNIVSIVFQPITYIYLL